MTASHAHRLDERELRLLRSACDTHQIALWLVGRAHGIHVEGRGVAADDRQAYLELSTTWRAARLVELTDAKACLMASLEHSVTAYLTPPGLPWVGGAHEEVALFDMDGLWSAPDPALRPGPTVTHVAGPHVDQSHTGVTALSWGPA